MPTWLDNLKQKIATAQKSDSKLDQPLKILLEPQQQMIGDSVYEVAFIADTDGLPLEFIRVLERK